MGFLKDLNVSNVLYAYDTLYGTTIILEHNNTIYMGDMMEYYLEISFRVRKMESTLTSVPKIIILMTLVPRLLISQNVQ